MSQDLSERSKHILEAIIEDYIATAEPVGSRTITRRHGIGLSPATVRNVMSDLEEMGYLLSPHTSAGRVPTDKAYRLYVDSLMGLRAMQHDEEEEIRRRYAAAGRDVGQILKETSRLLSTISHYMGIVVAPRFAANTLRQLEFVRLGGRRILAIIVADSGLVQNKIIEADREIPQEDLVRMGNYLNRLLAGLTIAQVRQRILQEMEDDKTSYDSLLASALELSRQTVTDDTAEFFVEGQANILDQPEFTDSSRLKEIFRAFEEKNQLMGLLDRCLQAPGVQIFIGAETHLNRLEGLSLVTASYMTGKNTLGVLGVIGPTRMGYAQVVPVVDYTARLVSRILEFE
jgi:heat-inducible transcriptional repressor